MRGKGGKEACIKERREKTHRHTELGRRLHRHSEKKRRERGMHKGEEREATQTHRAWEAFAPPFCEKAERERQA